MLLLRLLNFHQWFIIRFRQSGGMASSLTRPVGWTVIPRILIRRWRAGWHSSDWCWWRSSLGLLCQVVDYFRNQLTSGCTTGAVRSSSSIRSRLYWDRAISPGLLLDFGALAWIAAIGIIDPGILMNIVRHCYSPVALRLKCFRPLCQREKMRKINYPIALNWRTTGLPAYSGLNSL